jgi:hypothetical protein
MTTSKGKAKTVSVGTTIYRALVAVEGNDAARVRQANGSTFKVAIPATIAPRLRARLGSVVGLKGVATWRIRDMKMLAFEAEELTAYDPDSMPLTEAFEALAEASEGRWEGVDAVEYVNRVRYGIDSSPSSSSGDAPPGAAKEG